MGEDDVNVAHSSNIEPIRQDDILLRRPKKINRKLFENVDLEAQRIIEQQRIKEERDQKLAEEQALFAAQKQGNIHPVSQIATKLISETSCFSFLFDVFLIF